MATVGTWLHVIESNGGFDEAIKDMMIREMLNTHFVGDLPADLAFLGGSFVMMGFENLGGPEECRPLTLAFGDTGVALPGTRYRLRHASPGHSLVERIDGSERATLPEDWKQGVRVIDERDRFSWIGKKVPPDRIGEVDMGRYIDEGDGWALIA